MKRMNRRDFLRVAQVALTSALLAACQPPTPTPAPKATAIPAATPVPTTAPSATPVPQPTAKPTATSAPTAVPATPAPAVTGDIVMYQLAGSATVMPPLCRKFEEAHPQAKVKDTYMPFGEYETKLRMLFAAGTPPDVFWFYYNNTIEFPKNNLVLELDDLIAADRFPINDFFEISRKMFTVGGKLYGIPRESTSLALYWSKKAFEDAKLDPPNESWTTDTFLEAAKKLTVESKDPTQRKFAFLAGTGAGQLWATLPWVWLFGGDVVNDDRTAPRLMDEATIRGFQWVADLINVHKVAPAPGMLQGMNVTELFLKGQIAMQLNGRWIVPTLRQAIEKSLPGTDFDVTFIPKGPAGRFTRISAAAYAIGKKAQNIKGGWELIKFFSSKEVTEDLMVKGGVSPSIISVTKTDLFLEPGKSPAHMKVFADTMQYGRAEPIFENYAKLSNMMEAALDPVYNGKQSVREAFAAIQPQVQALFTK